jgi:hypothetical protein
MALFGRMSVPATAIVLLAACSSPSGPASVVEVSVTGANFERIGAPAIATVPFSVTNRGSSSVFVARCDSRVMAAVERWNGHSWVQYSSDACLAIYTTAAMELMPGASVTTSRPVPDPGVYRLRIGTTASASGEPDWSIVSGQFQVH